MNCTSVYARKYTIADTSLVLTFARASMDSNYKNSVASLSLAENAISVANELNYPFGLAKGLIAKAIASELQGKPSDAFNAYQQALRIGNKYGYQSILASVHDGLGVAYKDKGEYTIAIKHLDTAIKIDIALGDNFALAGVYSHFALLMLDIKNEDRSTEYELKAMAIYRSLHQREKVGEAYATIGGTYAFQNKYADALHYLHAALHIADSLNYTKYLQIAYMNLGLCHKRLGNKDSALHYYFKSLEILKQSKDVANETSLLCNIGVYYFSMNENAKAELYFKQSLELAKKVGDRFVILMGYENLTCLYKAESDYKRAFNYADSAFNLQDTIYQNSQAKAVAEITTKYETREVEQKNIVLQKENSLQKLRLQRKDLMMYSSVGAALLFLVIGFLLVRQNKLKTNEQKLELEQKQLLAQMNPHFIFNCLNSIQHFVMENDKLNANKYLADFALLMRQTLDNSKDGIISLTREIEYLENYLSFEYMRFKDKFDYTIACELDIDTDLLELPSMIIQPFAENAIRHGLCNLEKRRGQLTIRFYKKNETLYCEIDDNGIGMDQAKKLKDQAYIKYQSHGMELTQQRLALVSKANNDSYSVTIINKKDVSQNPEGTTIIIKFPLQA